MLQFGVADAAGRLDQPEPFGGAEGLLVERNRRCAVAHAQEGEGFVDRLTVRVRYVSSMVS